MRISDWSSDVCSSDLLTDDQVAELIFQPGFSTAEATTDLSGRGVGMDVVRRNVNELGGSVSVQTKAGAGSVFTITLPLTLAIIDGLTAAVGAERRSEERRVGKACGSTCSSRW